MKSALSFCGALGLLSLTVTQAMAAPAYFREPAINDNQLVINAEVDLWSVTLNDKQKGDYAATRLTTQLADETQPVISPDGKQLAFVANYEGAPEVYIKPIRGGLAERVTFENSGMKLHQWTADGKILYSTNSRVGPTNSYVLKLLDVKSGKTTTLPLADAVEGVIDDKGEWLYFVRFGLQLSGDNANYYQGGAKGRLWRWKLGSTQEAELLTAEHEGSIRTPMLNENRLFFISNQDGIDNLWSITLDGKAARKETQYNDWTVRGAAMGNGKAVYQNGADLVVRDLKAGSNKTLPIQLVSDFPYLREHWDNSPLELLKNVSLANTGDAVVITARGRIAVATTDGSRLVEIATPEDSRSRQALLSKDRKWVYALNDASGELEIWRFAADGSAQAEQLTQDASTYRWQLSLSPDGKWLAFDDKAGAVWLMNLEDKSQVKVFDDSDGLFAKSDIVWSGDSNMLAVTRTKTGNERNSVFLYSLQESKGQDVTSDKYQSYSPAFSADGKWLYFLSERNFVATPSNPWGDRAMGTEFDKRTQIFALNLTDDAEFSFSAPTELTRVEQEADSKDDENTEQDEDGKEAIDSSRIQWDGLNARLWQVPVAPGNYYGLSANKSLLFVGDRSGRNATLKALEFKHDAKLKTVTSGIAGYELSADGKAMFVFKRGNGNKNMYIVPAKSSFPKDLSDAQVKAGDWQMRINPQKEWAQLFHDAWLMHRESLFDPTMRGVDWEQVEDKYAPLLKRVTHRDELNDVFAQMMGEMNTLHSQVRGGDIPTDKEQPKAAMLGGVFDDTEQGVKITHIYRYDTEVPSDAPPLAQSGVDAQEGDIIESVNGRDVKTEAQLVSALLNKAGKQVLLELVRNGEKLKTVVTPATTGKDFGLRYQDWVLANGEKVSEANEDIGYLHLYAMGGGDVANFAREFYAQYRKDGLIIDVRRNRGGNVDSMILEKLPRRVWMFWQYPDGSTGTNMQQTFRGHLVVLADQFTYSDGETFTAGVRAMRIAPVIGKTTAGAGVWLTGRNSVADNGMARVAEFPVFAADGRWITEGRGISPDIEVDNLPYATFNGEDAQLEAAIKYLEEQIKLNPINPLKGEAFPGARTPAKDVNK